MLNVIDRLFNQHRFVRRAGVVMVYTINIFFAYLAYKQISANVGLSDGWREVLIAFLGLNALYLEAYRRSRIEDGE